MTLRKPVDVTKFSHRQAIDYFHEQGGGLEHFKQLNVGPRGLDTEERNRLIEALEGMRSQTHTDTSEGLQYAKDVVTYLEVLGRNTSTIEPTQTQLNWSQTTARGHSTLSWFRYAALKLEEWWLNLRNTRK